MIYNVVVFLPYFGGHKKWDGISFDGNDPGLGF